MSGWGCFRFDPSVRFWAPWLQFVAIGVEVFPTKRKTYMGVTGWLLAFLPNFFHKFTTISQNNKHGRCIFCLSGGSVSVELEAGAEWSPPVQTWQHSAYGARLPEFVPYAPLLEKLVVDGLQLILHCQWAWWHSWWGNPCIEIISLNALKCFDLQKSQSFP